MLSYASLSCAYGTSEISGLTAHKLTLSYCKKDFLLLFSVLTSISCNRVVVALVVVVIATRWIYCTRHRASVAAPLPARMVGSFLGPFCFSCMFDEARCTARDFLSQKKQNYLSGAGAVTLDDRGLRTLALQLHPIPSVLRGHSALSRWRPDAFSRERAPRLSLSQLRGGHTACLALVIRSTCYWRVVRRAALFCP